MEKYKEIFGSLADNPSFKSDVLFLNRLAGKIEQILNVYLKSNYRDFFRYGEKFAELLDVSIENSHRLWHLLDFFSYFIVPKYETDDIIEALNDLTQKKLNLKKFIEKLKDEKTQDILKELDLVDDEIGTINPHYLDVVYNIQERKVLKDDKIIKSLPIVNLQIITHREEPDENVFEFLEEDIDQIIDKFNEIKKKIKIIKGK